MTSGGCDVGLVGLGTMGRALALNLAEHRFSVALYNRTRAILDQFLADPQASAAAGEGLLVPSYSLDQMVETLRPPRVVFLVVTAGPGVDAVLDGLGPLLSRGDVIIDGGNSHFKDTAARQERLARLGIALLGVGISGGERGARSGPSLMPGGDPHAYDLVQPMLEAIAARAEGEPCVRYLGRGPAGHFVKMVHNGIEYGLMQLLAEIYGFLHGVAGISHRELAHIFHEWLRREAASYLLEITIRILEYQDPESGCDLLDLIADEAEQLGTGRWTSETGLELGVPIPNVDAGVWFRALSARASDRMAVGPVLRTYYQARSGAHRPASGAGDQSSKDVVEAAHEALAVGMLSTFAQGFSLLQEGSRAFSLGITMADVASVWRAGCIIRTPILKRIRDTYRAAPDLPHLLADGDFAALVASGRGGLAAFIEEAVRHQVPVPGCMAAVSYLDALGSERLPTALIQAQRDFFGAHGFRRRDKPGQFHANWQGGS